MKKLLLILSLVLLPSFVYAQFTKNSLRDSLTVVVDSIETEEGWLVVTKTSKIKIIQLNNFNDNWFVSFGVGPHIYDGENDWKMRIQDRLVPAIDFSIGKWFSPSIGGDAYFSFSPFRGAWLTNGKTVRETREKTGCTEDEALRIIAADYNFVTYDRYTDSPNRPQEMLFKQKGFYANAFLRIFFDMNTIFGGYNEDRKNHICPFIGAGYAVGLSEGLTRAGSPSFNTGILYEHRFNRDWSFNATARAAIFGDSFEGEYTASRTGDGVFGLAIGFAYKFGKKYWERVKEENLAYRYDKKVIALEKEVVKKEEEIVKTKEEAEVRYEHISGTLFPHYVNFALDDTTLVNREKVNLSVVSRVMKENPNKVYILSGYADKQTGTVERNQWLSENRSKRVAQVLTDEFGINPKQLELKFNGGVGNMFYDENALSRCVVISIKDEN